MFHIVKLIPKYLISFIVIVNGFPLSLYPLFIYWYIKAIYFCMFIYIMILTGVYLFELALSSILWGFPCILSCYLQIDSFIPSLTVFVPLINFCHLIALANILSALLNSRINSGHAYFVPNFSEDASTFSSLNKIMDFG